MKKKTFRFSKSKTDFYFDKGFSSLQEIANRENSVLLTDENVFRLHHEKFLGWKKIVIPPGESNKVQATVDEVIRQLIELEADRTTTLVGVGGGVITDITGYVASIYMRGISFGFVPTTLLAMVDASIGGKNGVDVGLYKNMVGMIRQPSFILYDAAFVETLPEQEWRNGFAEIIKHASIMDAAMFRELEKNNLQFYQSRKKKIGQLVERNALLKTKVVIGDEFEDGNRKLLNFGHTLGHAMENQYALSHGEAISIGMAQASLLSEKFLKFKNATRVIRLLEAYGLPVSMSFDKDRVIGILKMDKKKTGDGVNFILLKSIGKAVVKKISLEKIYENI